MTAQQFVHRYHWIILALALIAQFGNSLVITAIAPLAPIFQPELRLTKAQVGTFASAAFIGTWLMLLLGGTFTDRLGVRRMMSLGLFIAGVSMLFMPLASTFLVVLGIMFVSGFGRGIIMPASAKAISDWFTPSFRATAMGLKQSGMPAAGMVTASTLPFLGLLLGWRYSMALAGTLIIACGVATAILYRDRDVQQRSPAATKRTEKRIGVGDLIHNRRLWALNTMALLLVFTQLSAITYITLYFKEVVLLPLVPDERARIVAAGGYLALLNIGGIVGRVLLGGVSDRFFGGRRTIVLAWTCLLSAATSFVVSTACSADYPFWLLSLIMIMYGISVLGWSGLWLTSIVETVGQRYAATAVGFSLSLTQLGNVGGPPFFGFVVDVTGSYSPAWLLLTLLCGCAAIIGFLSAGEEKRLD